MDVILVPVLGIMITLIDIYIWILIAAIIVSWLTAFNVINTSNQVVYMIANFLYRVTEPVLMPIRRRLPDFGGMDVSPVILVVVLSGVQMALGMLINKVHAM